MPLFRNANIFNLFNPTVLRIKSNGAGAIPIPMTDGYCPDSSVWVSSIPRNRRVWVQVASNNSMQPLVFELTPQYGRKLVEISARVAGVSYTILPTYMPRLQLWSMDALGSVLTTDWTVVGSKTDPVTTVGDYNTYHRITLTCNTIFTEYNRYAIAVLADQSSTHSMVLEGLFTNTVFTEEY